MQLFFYFRQAQDRYYDPALDGSLNGFPVGSDYKGGGGAAGSGVHQMDTLNRADYDGSDLASHQQAAYMQSQQLLREHNSGLASLPPQTPIMAAQALRPQTPVMMAPTPLPQQQGSAFNLAGGVNAANVASRMSTQTLPTMAHPTQQPYILPQGNVTQMTHLNDKSRMKSVPNNVWCKVPKDKA